MKEINQFLPGFTLGDAISNYALVLREVFRRWGFKSEIFAVGKNIHPELREEGLDYRSYVPTSPGNIAIYHLSIGSELTGYFRSIPEKRVIIYHNITPPHFIDGYNDFLRDELQRGREELQSLRDSVSLALADSEFNRKELEEFGFQQTRTFPVMIDFEKYNGVANPEILNKYREGTNIIFVGRIIPNKCQEDLLKMFYLYQRHFNPRSRLILIGSFSGLELFYRQIMRMAFRMKLRDVIAPGHVTDQDLFAYYQTSHLFLSMSEHEGFCVPLLEAMFYRVPVVAFNAGGVSYTLGDAGILVNEKNYLEIAALIDLIVRDERLREKIVQQQLKRLEELQPSRWEDTLKKILLEHEA